MLLTCLWPANVAVNGGWGGGGIFVHVAKETKRGGNSLKVGTMLMANCLI